MSTFSRVKHAVIKEVTDIASMYGIGCHVLPYDEDHTEWATFQFHSANEKNAFEKIIKENGYTVESDLSPEIMIDRVIEGESPSEIIDNILD